MISTMEGNKIRVCDSKPMRGGEGGIRGAFTFYGVVKEGLTRR